MKPELETQTLTNTPALKLVLAYGELVAGKLRKEREAGMAFFWEMTEPSECGPSYSVEAIHEVSAFGAKTNRGQYEYCNKTQLP